MQYALCSVIDEIEYNNNSNVAFIEEIKYEYSLWWLHNAHGSSIYFRIFPCMISGFIADQTNLSWCVTRDADTRKTFDMSKFIERWHSSLL